VVGVEAVVEAVVGVEVGVEVVINILRGGMKRVIVQSTNEGLESLLGEKVTLFCTRYIYTGILTGLNDNFCLLTEPKIVYDTGAFDKKDWQDAQSLPKPEWYVMLHSIESFGIMK